jgi:hypothetical protein
VLCTRAQRARSESHLSSRRHPKTIVLSSRVAQNEAVAMFVKRYDDDRGRGDDESREMTDEG